MFELRIPVCTKKFLKYIDKSLREDLLGFSGFDGERIEAERILFICRIEYDHVTLPTLWYMHHDFFDEIPVRIYDRESLPIGDVVDHLSYEELALPDSCLPDHVHMPQAILIIDTDRYTDTAIVRLSEYGECRIMRRHYDICATHRIRKYRHTDRECELASIDLLECSLLRWITRESIESRDLVGCEYEHRFALLHDPLYRIGRTQRMDTMVELIEWRILE